MFWWSSAASSRQPWERVGILFHSRRQNTHDPLNSVSLIHATHFDPARRVPPRCIPLWEAEMEQSNATVHQCYV